jgi:hypothetical protein
MFSVGDGCSVREECSVGEGRSVGFSKQERCGNKPAELDTLVNNIRGALLWAEDVVLGLHEAVPVHDGVCNLSETPPLADAGHLLRCTRAVRPADRTFVRDFCDFRLFSTQNSKGI